MKKCAICNSKNIVPYKRLSFVNDILLLLKCNNCNFVFQKNFNNIDLSYDENYYLREKIISTRFLKEKAEYKFNLIKPFISNKKKILEIGCSTGEFLEVCQSNGYETTGLEISRIAYNKSKEKGLNILHGDIDAVYQLSHKFDVLIMFDVLEHLTDFNIFFKNISSILDENGVIIIETPNYNSIIRLFNPYKWVGYNKFHLTYFNPYNLNLLLSKYGFKKEIISTSIIDVFSLNFWKRTYPYYLLSSLIKNIMCNNKELSNFSFPLFNKYNFDKLHLNGDEMIGIFFLQLI